MSKRLQVLLDPKEYKEFMRLAKREKLSLGEWVRRSLRMSARRAPRRSVEEKLAFLDEFSRRNYDAPVGTIEQMNAEIAAGRAAGWAWMGDRDIQGEEK